MSVTGSLAIRQLFARFWWIVPIMAFAVALFLTRQELAVRTNELAAEKSAHGRTAANIRAASAEAARRDAENIVRVRAEQDAIKKEIVDDYEVRLADVRARAERLRSQAAANTGSAAAIPLPAASAATGRADEAACDNRFSLEQRLAATEQALQLDALISWAGKQADVVITDQAGGDV